MLVYTIISRKHLDSRKQRAKRNNTSHSSMTKTTKRRVGRPNRRCLPLEPQWRRHHRQYHRQYPYLLLYAPTEEAALALAEKKK
jgi:hypothetical protein